MKTRSQSHSTSDNHTPRPSPASLQRKKVKPSKRLQSAKSISTSPKVPARKAPGFSWVVDGLLAAHGRPAQHGHVQYLCDQGIELLITLTENKPRAVREYPGEGLEWKHIPLKDEKPPSVDQACEFVSLVEESERLGKKMSVHCAWGKGRTGTLLACYLAKREALTAEAAISKVRNLRPGSIDTSQEETVHQYVTSQRF